jgi:L-alanine-DL-glutamate epimerase-like enolase superfamily enzyme
MIEKTWLGFEREPLMKPFGFKGGYVSEIWNVAALIEEEGRAAAGLGIQSVLWSDAGVFSRMTPAGGNCLMYLITEYALKRLKGMEIKNPLDAFDEIYPDALRYARALTGMERLRPTFALNALVPVDMALWRLYAAKNGIDSFDGLIPGCARDAMRVKQRRVAGIPLITYGLSAADVAALAESGAPLIKIKIGSDPAGDGDQEKMLRWDMDRLSEIHAAVRDVATPHTDSGHVAYYLDANGRYESRERLDRLLEHADREGILPHVALLEEPFPEGSGISVRGIPVPVAADESAHSVGDARELIDQGYTAIALKPIAKTLSMSFRILGEAHRRGVPCFCADLTVNPLMVEWNKNFAARLMPLKGMKVGVLEVNGHQNYANWEKMKGFHPLGGAPWVDAKGGLYELGEAFYQASGGIFLPAPHYERAARGV